MTAWWSRSLGRQIIGLMLIALVIGQTIGFGISWTNRRAALKEAAQSEFVSRTATLSEVIQTMPDDLQRNVLQASATMHTRFWTTPDDPRPEGRAWYFNARSHLLEPLSNIMTNPKALADQAEDEAVIEHIRNKPFAGWSDLDNPLWTYASPASVLPFADEIGMGLVVPLPNGAWLNAVFYKSHIPDLGTIESLASTIAAALVLCLFGFISTRRIARPLQALAQAAEGLGRGEGVSPVTERGSDDIRNLCVAFNQMQHRLHRFIDDRTRMLAAIGHDLRTPLTTLRLRTELVADEELKARMVETIEEMQSMTAATLTFSKNDAAVEDTRNVDLGALVGSLCDDMAELGHDIAFVDSGVIAYRCRPDGLKRAVRNLIENACRYADSATVSLVLTGNSVDICVDDQGPGIPLEEIEQVFAPFYRLEQSRSRETGGVGLGLSIARAIARQHGGNIHFSPNTPGLHAVLSLPRM